MNRYLKSRRLVFLASLAVILAVLWMFFRSEDSLLSMGTPSKERIIPIVTVEYSGKTEDGREFEVYRWDPGTIFVKEGETVLLQIYGIHGDRHPFFIEGTNINGEIRKGQMTSVRFEAKKEGVYRLICPTHTDFKHQGPMIAHIIVD